MANNILRHPHATRYPRVSFTAQERAQCGYVTTLILPTKPLFPHPLPIYSAPFNQLSIPRVVDIRRLLSACFVFSFTHIKTLRRSIYTSNKCGPVVVDVVSRARWLARFDEHMTEHRPLYKFTTLLASLHQHTSSTQVVASLVGTTALFMLHAHSSTTCNLLAWK